MRLLAPFVVALAMSVLPAVTLLAADQQAPAQTPSFTLPPVVVTAQKEPADSHLLPISVTAVSGETIEASGINLPGEAVLFSPNTLFAEMSARKVSNPYIRGVGSSPANPGVTTYIDGVPLLNANASNVELIGIERIEFVRGAQSALFGRNAIGGLVTITTARPSMTRWATDVEASLGSEDQRGTSLLMSGPLGERAALGVAVGGRARSGFTVNDLTGHTLGDRSAFFGRAQFSYTPSVNWDTRLTVGGERDRDGDYAFADLAEARRNRFHASRDVEGHTHRDIWSTTFLVRHEGSRYAFSSTTGGVWWNTDDFTDLDYSPAPLLTRKNREDDTQFTQEFRLASAERAPLNLSSDLSLGWQAGFTLFTQDYQQDVVTTYAPYVVSPAVPVATEQRSPNADLEDRGLGVYALGTLTAWSRVGLTFGARVDRETRSAAIDSSFSPAIAPSARMEGERTYSDVSPQAAVTWRPRGTLTLYASANRGFKAGGFNTFGPAGNESYDEEHAWNTEGGIKATLAGGKVVANAAYYRIEWSDMQLTVPTPGGPAQFYIANVGKATSSGVELELNARPVRSLDVFGTFGTASATFGAGSVSGGLDVSGHELPFAPDYTASMGFRVWHPLGRSMHVTGGGEVLFSGSYHYDDHNVASQSAYSLVNLRGGVRAGRVGVEVWVKNAFDTEYVPLAFAYGALTPSGYVGEAGAPRVFGLTARVGF